MDKFEDKLRDLCNEYIKTEEENVAYGLCFALAVYCRMAKDEKNKYGRLGVVVSTISLLTERD